MAFATVEDLEARWRALTADETEKAEVLLGDAGTYLSLFVNVDPEDEEQAEALKIVSCNMVRRVMNVTDDMLGVTEGTMTADIYSQRFAYANPNGDWYLTATEKRLLGISRSFISSMRPVIWGEHIVD